MTAYVDTRMQYITRIHTHAQGKLGMHAKKKHATNSNIAPGDPFITQRKGEIVRREASNTMLLQLSTSNFRGALI